MTKKNNIIIIVLALVILGFLFFPKVGKSGRKAIIDFCAPIARVFTGAGKIVRAPFVFFSDIANLRKDRDNLIEKLAVLQVDESQLSELKTENDLLKKELGFLPDTGIKEVIPANIIQREPSSFLDYIIVDRGSEDGVTLNAAVLSSGIFIGQVKEVYQTTSKIVLVTSKDSLIQAMLQNSRSKGILRGGISGLFLENIMQDTEFKKDEYIVTSGLGGTIKSGLLIGRADEVQTSNSSIYKSISVEPLVDLSKLELIFIEK